MCISTEVEDTQEKPVVRTALHVKSISIFSHIYRRPLSLTLPHHILTYQHTISSLLYPPHSPTSSQEVGIYERKQENTLSTKKSTKKKEKNNNDKKKEIKNALDQESK